MSRHKRGISYIPTCMKKSQSFQWGSWWCIAYACDQFFLSAESIISFGCVLFSAVDGSFFLSNRISIAFWESSKTNPLNRLLTIYSILCLGRKRKEQKWKPTKSGKYCFCVQQSTNEKYGTCSALRYNFSNDMLVYFTCKMRSLARTTVHSIPPAQECLASAILVNHMFCTMSVCGIMRHRLFYLPPIFAVPFALFR